jgi:shikimate kinase/3-dehydroquinate synthase
MTAPAVVGLRRVVLIGFGATGKSAVARALAGRLGWKAVDTDDLIEAATARAIPDIFAEDGEPVFRRLEVTAVREAALESDVVVATGGGVWLDAANREALADGGFVVGLEARLDTILGRHAAAEQGRPDARPLLAGANPVARIQTLKAERQPFYALSDATIHTDGTPVDEVVDEIVRALERDGKRALDSRARLHAMTEGPGVPSTLPTTAPLTASLPEEFGDDVAAMVSAGGASYPIYCGWGLLSRLPDILERVGLAGRAFVVSDAAVRSLYGEPIVEALGAAGRSDAGRSAGGRSAVSFEVPSGEASKSLAGLERIYEWLAAERAERGDVIIAVGGGVVTDLAGTAAATYLRGMPMVHVPTTLLGMVDASIGGKVAIDLPAGKNLVGAFHQPRAVVADIATLASLPERELRAGYGEVIKHAFIRDAGMLDELERDASALLRLNSPDADRSLAVDLIGRNMAIKAAVVSADERESDLRMVLNYGHTIGHALEAVTGYASLLHGEAVAIGLMGAAFIGERMGLIDAATAARHRSILERFGLPTSLEGVSVEAGTVDVDAVLEAMLRDKKVSGGTIRWVLLDGVGQPVVRDDVPASLVEEAVRSVVEG